MKIEKLPSGNYRVRKTIDKKVYSLTFPYKPGKKDVEKALFEKLTKQKENKSPSSSSPSSSLERNENITERSQNLVSFETAGRTYIDAKEQILSPSTIAGYESILRNISEELKQTPLENITALMVQKEINQYAKTHSPKSVKNMHGFIVSVFHLFNIPLQFVTTLPQEEVVEFYEPTREDICRILQYAQGTPYEIALRLAAIGLRKSEIIALSVSDLDEDNILHIHKSTVLDKENNWVMRNKNKTKDSTRLLPLPDDLAQTIRTQGFIYQGKPRNILRFLYRAQDALGIPRFRLHDFRHYFAAVMNEETDEATSLYLGGWKTDYVMKRIYRYSLKKKDSEALRDVLKKTTTTDE